MMALINSEEMKQEKHQASHKTLTEWWNQVVRADEATENDIASEIRVFKLSAPPSKNMTDQDEGEEFRKAHVKIEVVMENKTIQMTLRQVLKEMGAEIKNGPPPCNKPIRKVKALLRALQRG